MYVHNLSESIYRDQQFIVGITVYVIGNIGIERKVRIEVMADFFAIHKHHAVSGNGFKMKQEAFPVPAGRHAEVLTQPAHTGVLPIVRIAWVVNGAGRVGVPPWVMTIRHSRSFPVKPSLSRNLQYS